MVTGLCIQRPERHSVQIFHIDWTGGLKHDRRVNNIIFFTILNNIFIKEFYYTKLEAFVFGKKSKYSTPVYTNKEILQSSVLNPSQILNNQDERVLCSGS